MNTFKRFNFIHLYENFKFRLIKQKNYPQFACDIMYTVKVTRNCSSNKNVGHSKFKLKLKIPT